METENLRWRLTTESLKTNPIKTVYENDNYVVVINNNYVEIAFKAYAEEDEIDQMQIRQLYNNQGNKITLKNILDNIETQYKIYD